MIGPCLCGDPYCPSCGGMTEEPESCPMCGKDNVDDDGELLFPKSACCSRACEICWMEEEQRRITEEDAYMNQLAEEAELADPGSKGK